MSSLLRPILFGTVLAVVACVPPPDGTGDRSAQAAKAEERQKPEKPTPSAAESNDSEPDQAGPSSGAPPIGRGGEHIKAEPAPPLTAEQETLIAADSATLSKEDRRKRSYAQRQKIMQKPDSPQAQALLEGAERLRRGEMDPPPGFGASRNEPEQGITLQPPTAAKPPPAPAPPK
jgi:hypothetical protein